jgi:hypothetical protein
MRLGERSARIRPGDWGKLTIVALALMPALAAAQGDSSAASVGPGRIVCNATFCELAVAARTRPRVRVIVSALPAEQIHRLRKCTGVAKPCIVTVDGTAQDHPYRIMATDIHWQD